MPVAVLCSLCSSRRSSWWTKWGWASNDCTEITLSQINQYKKVKVAMRPSNGWCQLDCWICICNTLEIGKRHIGQVRVRLSNALAHSLHMQKCRHGKTVVFFRFVRHTTQSAEKSPSPFAAWLASVIPYISCKVHMLAFKPPWPVTIGKLYSVSWKRTAAWNHMLSQHQTWWSIMAIVTERSTCTNQWMTMYHAQQSSSYGLKSRLCRFPRPTDRPSGSFQGQLHTCGIWSSIWSELEQHQRPLKAGYHPHSAQRSNLKYISAVRNTYWHDIQLYRWVCWCKLNLRYS